MLLAAELYLIAWHRLKRFVFPQNRYFAYPFVLQFNYKSDIWEWFLLIYDLIPLYCYIIISQYSLSGQCNIITWEMSLFSIDLFYMVRSNWKSVLLSYFITTYLVWKKSCPTPNPFARCYLDLQCPVISRVSTCYIKIKLRTVRRYWSRTEVTVYPYHIVCVYMLNSDGVLFSWFYI